MESIINKQEEVALACAMLAHDFLDNKATEDAVEDLLKVCKKNKNFFSGIFSGNQKSFIPCLVAVATLIERILIPRFVSLNDFNVQLFHKYFWARVFFGYTSTHPRSAATIVNSTAILKTYSKHFKNIPFFCHFSEADNIVITNNCSVSITMNEKELSLALIESMEEKYSAQYQNDLTEILHMVAQLTRSGRHLLTQEFVNTHIQAMHLNEEITKLNLVYGTLFESFFNDFAPLPFVELSNQDIANLQAMSGY